MKEENEKMKDENINLIRGEIMKSSGQGRLLE